MYSMQYARNCDQCMRNGLQDECRRARVQLMSYRSDMYSGENAKNSYGQNQWGKGKSPLADDEWPGDDKNECVEKFCGKFGGCRDKDYGEWPSPSDPAWDDDYAFGKSKKKGGGGGKGKSDGGGWNDYNEGYKDYEDYGKYGGGGGSGKKGKSSGKKGGKSKSSKKSFARSAKKTSEGNKFDICEPYMLPYQSVIYPLGPTGPKIMLCPYVPVTNCLE